MSKIAQQLCGEIVEPALATSSCIHHEIKATSSVPDIVTTRAVYHCPKLEDHNGKRTESIVIEKKKIIKNLGPKNSNGSKNVINRFKSSEILLKKDLADMAVNTVMSGAFRCDNHCNTMVRQREMAKNNQCKCGNKRICNKTNPIINPKSYSKHMLRDKACAQIVETASCGTQFLENVKRINSIRFQHPHAIATQTSICAPAKIEVGMQSYTSPYIQSQMSSKKIPFRPFQKLDSTLESNVRSMTTARRWALSRYPILGPDF